MMQMAGYSSSKHLPFTDVLAVLGLTTDAAPSEDAPSLSSDDLKYLFRVMAARIRQASVSDALAPTVTELQKHHPNLSKMFQPFKEKDIIPKATIMSILTGVLLSEFHESVLPLVNFISYNCRDHVRLCDLDAAFAPPIESSDNQEEVDYAAAAEEDAAKALAEFNKMAEAIEEAENLAKAAVDEEEIAKVIDFLDPSNDGEVDFKELESAFRIARRDQTREVIDLDSQAKELENLKKQLEEASKVEEGE